MKEMSLDNYRNNEKISKLLELAKEISETEQLTKQDKADLANDIHSLISKRELDKNFDNKRMYEAVQNLLLSFGCDLEDPAIKETPRRVVGYWNEVLEGMKYTNEEIAKMYSKDFEVSSQNLVIKEVKNVYSHCEHHLALMFNGTVCVAYIPKETDNGNYRVLGLSKIDRIVKMCAKRLQLQERLCYDIAECIGLATGSTEIYVYSKMNHGCVSARGPMSEGATEACYISPNLQNNIQARDEIERYINSLNK